MHSLFNRLSPSILVVVTLLLASMVARGADVTVGSASQLHSALSQANAAGGETTIQLQPGVYSLDDTLYVNAPGIRLLGDPAQPENVVIEGDAMRADASVGNVIRVAADRFELRGITVQKSRWHAVQVTEGADQVVLQDCVLRDVYEQLLKVTVDSNQPSVTSDDGLVERCLFEYSAGIGPQYYIGGIDAHAAKRWVVRDNEFRSIASPSGSVAEFAIHFWNGSADNLVERNLIVNSDRGIGFGLSRLGNQGGVIRNNMIYHADNGHPFADVGIALSKSPGTQVYNNTVVLEHGMPWSIEYRFPETQNAEFINNLSNKPIQARDGATATLHDNILTAAPEWFADAAGADLHLTEAAGPAIDAGRAIPGLVDDFDGQTRADSAPPDIGADELQGSVPRPPVLLD